MAKYKHWTKEEDEFLLKYKELASLQTIADFFGVNFHAVNSRIIRVRKGLLSKYHSPLKNSKTREEMQDFLNFLEKGTVQKEVKVQVQDEPEETSEEAFTYQIVSAKVISITSGEVIIGNYKISGSFSLTLI
jgi:predicted DNA-binding protein YlxM (UPF0122 family)